LGVDARLGPTSGGGLGLVDQVGNGMMPTSVKSRFADVLDGLSNTILYAESAGRPYLYRLGKLITSDLTVSRINGGGWPRPASDFTLFGLTADGTTSPGPCAINCANGIDIVPLGYPAPYYNTLGTGQCYAFHPGGANVAFGDSSVRFVQQSIDIRIFAALITRDKGEAYQAPTGP
jgi:prepilin-type processing-associated H-X9-DG protein